MSDAVPKDSTKSLGGVVFVLSFNKEEIMNTTDIARNRAIFLDSILSSLNKASVKDAVEVTLNCSIKDFKALKALKAEKNFVTSKGAQLRCVSESANTIVTVNVTRG